MALCLDFLINSLATSVGLSSSPSSPHPAPRVCICELLILLLILHLSCERQVLYRIALVLQSCPHLYTQTTDDDATSLTSSVKQSIVGSVPNGSGVGGGDIGKGCRGQDRPKPRMAKGIDRKSFVEWVTVRTERIN